MKKFFRWLLLRPVLWLSRHFSSNADKQKVFAELDDLLLSTQKNPGKKGITIPFDHQTGRFIVFSDMHKGGGDSADDFMICADNYLQALDYYHAKKFHFIALGDSEELWESNLANVKKVHPKTFEKEKQFIPQNAFTKVFGNHDLYWGNDPFAALELKKIYETDIKIYEGVVLQTTIGDSPLKIYCTHGHQGDQLSDGNWFSKFFVARIWAPLQSYLHINPNTPAYDAQLKTRHNSLMYEWSAQQKNLLLITGHTHQPVFESLTHLERLYRQLLLARQKQNAVSIALLEKEIEIRKWQYSHVSDDYLQMKPTYFNSGCCCNDDGEITGIEIDEGCMRLVKWTREEGNPMRIVLEESPLEDLLKGTYGKY